MDGRGVQSAGGRRQTDPRQTCCCQTQNFNLLLLMLSLFLIIIVINHILHAVKSLNYPLPESFTFFYEKVSKLSK